VRGSRGARGFGRRLDFGVVVSIFSLFGLALLALAPLGRARFGLATESDSFGKSVLSSSNNDARPMPYPRAS
jgi:hypothetical protein